MNEMLCIEINFGKNKSDHIVVHFDDTSEELAKEFVKKHNLKEGAIPKVTKYIEDTVKEFKEQNAIIRPQTPPQDIRGNDNIDRDITRATAGTHHPAASMQPPKDLPTTLHRSESKENFGCLNEKGPIECVSQSGSDLSSAPIVDVPLAVDCAEISEIHPVDVSTRALSEEDQESRYNKIRDNVSIASSRQSATAGSRGSRPSEPIPLMEKMRRVDFFTSNDPEKRKRRTKAALSANERLYKAAFSMKDRKDKLIEQQEKKEEEALRSAQFKLPEGSKKLLTRYRADGAGGQSIGERLHNDGEKDREKKLKVAEAALREKEKAESIQLTERNRHVNNWSCANCGTFHTFTSLERTSFDFKKICKSCGTDQSTQKAFQPTNVAFDNPVKGGFDPKSIDRKVENPSKIHDSNSNLNSSAKENDLAGQQQGVSKSNSVHHQLHNQKQLQDLKRVQLVCKYLDEEQKVYPFRPSIPSSSTAIVEKLKESDAQLQQPCGDGTEYRYVSEKEAWYGTLAGGRVGDRLSRSRSPQKKHMSSSSSMNTRPFSDDAVPFGEYFRLPASERLFAHGHKNRVIERRSQSSERNAPRASAESCTDGGSRSRSVTSKKEFIDRLVYEYNDKNAKLEDLIQKHMPTFKPQVQGFSSYLNREEHTTDAFIADLLRRGREIEDKRLNRQRLVKEAQEKQRIMNADIPRSLPHSEEILKQSTDKLIKEMFSLLITEENFDKSTTDPKTSDIQKFEGKLLNLATMPLNAMVDEVQEILIAAKEEHKATLDQKKLSSDNFNVNFDEFSALIKISMQKKKGPGKSYIYIPKKKADAVTQMKIEQDSELTFAPELNIPASILEGRVIANGVLSEYLYGQAEILKKKGDSYRENIKQQELKSCTFKPFLHKAPKGVQPAYRGLNGIVESHNELHDTRKKPQAVIHINGRTSSPLKSNLLNQSSVCGTPDSIQRKLDNILSGNDVNKGFLGDKPKSTDDVLVRTDRGISIESSSSLAGVRALGEYDENFIRLESCDEETIAKEKCQSQESFAVLKNTISNELGPEDETDKFSSALREGGSEIDSKTIPFETYYEKTGLASTRKSI